MTLEKPVILIDDGSNPEIGKALSKKVNRAVIPALMTGMLSGWGDWKGSIGLPLLNPKIELPETKCGLPSCNNKSKKDYCCAEHCKQHRAMQRENRKTS